MTSRPSAAGRDATGCSGGGATCGTPAGDVETRGNTWKHVETHGNDAVTGTYFSLPIISPPAHL